jgi:hypothetical protein
LFVVTGLSSQWQPAAVNMPSSGAPIVSVLFVALINDQYQPGGLALDDIVIYTGCTGQGSVLPGK